jgi:hypothetical protein
MEHMMNPLELRAHYQNYKTDKEVEEAWEESGCEVRRISYCGRGMGGEWMRRERRIVNIKVSKRTTIF